MVDYNMIINLFQAKDLIPSDSSGTSDPYVKVNYYG
jgi:hypothetical protein